MKYEKMTDELLIEKLRGGEKEIIDLSYGKIQKSLSAKKPMQCIFSAVRHDDLIQEGMIGLFKAVRDYAPDQNSSFYSFAKLCITRQLYSAITASRRKKHSPLNSYISLYETGADDQNPLIETVEAEGQNNPEELLISQEYATLIESRLEEALSDLESRVLYLHLRGTDYKTIAKLLDKSPKTIDNALQRIKNKTEKILKSDEKSY